MKWPWFWLAMGCGIVGVWITATSPWYYGTPLFFSALCAGLLAIEREEDE